MTMTAMILFDELQQNLRHYDLDLFEMHRMTVFPVFDVATGSATTASAFFVFRKIPEQGIKVLGVQVDMLSMIGMHRHQGIATALFERVVDRFDALGTVIKEGDPLPKPVRL